MSVGKELFNKYAFIIGPGFGAIRASGLSDEESKKLRKKYELDNDSNLVARNAGRGLAGGLAGGAVGSSIANLILSRNAKDGNFIKRRLSIYKPEVDTSKYINKGIDRINGLAGELVNSIDLSEPRGSISNRAEAITRAFENKLGIFNKFIVKDRFTKAVQAALEKTPTDEALRTELTKIIQKATDRAKDKVSNSKYTKLFGGGSAHPIRNAAITLGSGLAGSLLASYLATNKYSKNNV